MSKVRDRACGICGRAVVIPTKEEIERAFDSKRWDPTLQRPIVRKMVNGYVYEVDDATGKRKVVRILCHLHEHQENE